MARPKQELGEILLEADLITETQLHEALGLQRTFGERLASVLVRQNILTEKFAVTYLGRQLGIPAVDLSKSEIDLGLLDVVSLELCERHLVFPVKVEGTRLQLAMSDPTDHSLVSEIEFKTSVRIAPMIALEASIKNAILEARRALKAGQRKINPNVQRTKTVPLGGLESSPSGVATSKPAAESPTDTAPPPVASPIPVALLREQEQTVLETLGGAPLLPPRVTLASPPSLPEARSIPPPAPSVVAQATTAPATEAPPALPQAQATEAPPLVRAKEAPAPEQAPVPEPTPSELPRAESDRASAPEEPATILAVDDDEEMVRFMEEILRASGYKVITSLSGRDALAKVRESMPDLVILDGMLPEIHGFEICRQLKTSERFRHIPVALVSGLHRGWRFAADIKEKYGADDYIEKPFERADFLRRVEILLNRTPQGPSSASEAAARQHLKEGVIALKQERLDDAVSCFTKGLAIDSMNDLLHYYLAMTYEKRDMVFHAIDHYEKAIQINPDFYDSITALANLYQKQEFWRKAVEMWELALAATKDETVRGRIKDHLLSLL